MSCLAKWSMVRLLCFVNRCRCSDSGEWSSRMRSAAVSASTWACRSSMGSARPGCVAGLVASSLADVRGLVMRGHALVGVDEVHSRQGARHCVQVSNHGYMTHQTVGARVLNPPPRRAPSGACWSRRAVCLPAAALTLGRLVLCGSPLEVSFMRRPGKACALGHPGGSGFFVPSVWWRRVMGAVCARGAARSMPTFQGV